MQVSLSVRGFPEYEGVYHIQIKIVASIVVSQGLQKHWCGYITVFWGINQTKEIWVND